MRGDTVPVEIGIAFDQVGRGGVAELPIEADLLELVEERVGLLHVERISELTDQIRRLHQTPLAIFRGVCRRWAHWKAGELNRSGDPLGIQSGRGAKPLHDEDLRAVDMIPSERRV